MNIKKYVPLIFGTLYIVLFYIIYVHGGANFSKFIRFLLNHIQNNFPSISSKIGAFRSYDYGRIISRISTFIWSLLLYFLVTKTNKLTRVKSIAFDNSLKMFYWGMFWGTLAISFEIMISWLMNAIAMEAFDFKLTNIFYGVVLYFFCMLLTAFSEELIYRGYMLRYLTKYVDANIACLFTAFMFGIVHYYFAGSLLYACGSFFAGLLLGFLFLLNDIWCSVEFHFAWNFIEAIIYSESVFKIKILNVFFAGNRITPDNNGLISLIVISIGLVIILIYRYRIYRYQSLY